MSKGCYYWHSEWVHKEAGVSIPDEVCEVMGIPIIPQLKFCLNVSDKTGLGLYFSVLLLCSPACHIQGQDI